MNETATIERPAMTANEELSIPLDLSLWTPVAQLREWILANVATLDWTLPELLDPARTHRDIEPKALLVTSTLAYVTGYFGAEEIAPLCSSHPEFRAVRPKLPPQPADLKRFRKENHALLKWCLVDVITQAVRTRIIGGDDLEILPAGLRRFVVENAVERLDLARHLDRGAEL